MTQPWRCEKTLTLSRIAQRHINDFGCDFCGPPTECFNAKGLRLLNPHRVMVMRALTVIAQNLDHPAIGNRAMRALHHHALQFLL